MIDPTIGFYDPTKTYEQNWHEGPFVPTQVPYKNDGKPRYDFFGTPVYSPFGIAAGPIPTSRHVKAAFDAGFDIVTFKNARTGTYPCHPAPNVMPVDLDVLDPTKTDEPITLKKTWEQPLSMSNSFGIPSYEPEVWQAELRKSFALVGKGQALLATFQGTDRGEGHEAFIQDHVKGVQQVKDCGAKVIEVNMACPNEGAAQLLCFDIAQSLEVVKAVRESVPDITLLVKITYFVDKQELRKFVEQIGPLVDGITSINTIAARLVDENGEQAYPGGPARTKPGISGHAIKKAALEMTTELHKLREELGLNYKIIGVGGVVEPEDFDDYIREGADIVMSVAGAMWNPGLAAEIKAML